ncbi:Two-component response regulator W [hydrothermal vent metagenome]|uniref:Two-component response regulator W n=1 Tax=hydrothermal vent metagenome TaxID=652676 RepID=A0A3B1CAY7_9ZZZZ
MIFNDNIELFATINPEIAGAIVSARKRDELHILTTRNGLPCIKAGNITLHSLYNPLKEAESWVEHYREETDNSSLICVLGFALGYHILELCKTTHADIFVFEPRVDILKTAFELMDLTSVLSRIRFITDDAIPRLRKDFVVVEHKPSVNLNPEYFGKIRSRLNVLRNIRRGLKIMVVGPIYGGSLPIAGYCARALSNLGHEVDFVDNSRYKDVFLSIDSITDDKMHRDRLREMFINFVSETVIARCGEIKPDLVFALAQAPLTESSLQKLMDSKIPTAFWFVEDFRVMDYWQRVAPFYDYFFTIQKGQFFESLRGIGVKNFSSLPLAAAMDIHEKKELSGDELKIYGSDVSFVGAGYYNRRKFFEGLLDFDFRIWGNEWNLNSPLGRCIQRSGERMDTEDIVKIFTASKINVNLHSSTYHEGVNPYGDFVNPRTFEISSCEGFQLVDARTEIQELFKVGEEIVCFKDLSDLRRKIRYYLNNPDERKAIAGRAMERVKKDHTYELRMKEMLDLIVSMGYDFPPWHSEGEVVEELVDAAGMETELGRYLARFTDKGKVELGDIVEDIRAGEGALSGVEKIFLLMDSIQQQYAFKK